LAPLPSLAVKVAHNRRNDFVSLFKLASFSASHIHCHSLPLQPPRIDNMADHYQCLAISYKANANEIKRAYRLLALQNHPDKTLKLPSEERLAREVYFKAATDAYEILSDATKKKHYDNKLTCKWQQYQPASSYAPSPPSKSQDYQTQEAERAAAEAVREEKRRRKHEGRKRRKQERQQQRHDQEERHRNAQAEYDRYFNSRPFAAPAAEPDVPELQAEDMHTVSEINQMGYIVHRTFGEWTYELRISKLFNLCRTARPIELFPKDSMRQTELHIQVELRAAECIKPWEINTEEICLRITSAPGVVDRFETYFKECHDGICLLTIILRASSLLSYLVFVAPLLELPIDVRLCTNWAPFGKRLDTKVRVTHMRFFGEQIDSPRTFVRYEDEEMEEAEMVDVRDEEMRVIKCGWRFWKRAAEVGFVRRS
jgi:curved DNA-binding protein CbpA